MSNIVGQNVRGYELREKIGEGGFALVYRAFQAAIQREVAIKVILPAYANQPDFIRRFETEAQIVARLEHTHIVPVYDFWREPDGAYLVMRWLRGGSLRSALAQDGHWTLQETARLVDQIAGALALAHYHNVVHRDLKPANILLDENRDAYLSDFGIAKSLQEDKEDDQQGVVKGTLGYIAPEQLQDLDVTGQADLYSLGITIYEMLTGQPAIPRNTPLDSVIYKQIREPLPSLKKSRPELPEEVDAFLQRATAKQPDDRFPDAIAMALAFREAIKAELPNIQLPADGETAIGLDRINLRTVDFILELDNPYKGLRAFQQTDEADFFGRDSLIERLLSRMRDDQARNGQTRDGFGRFLAVVGPSGSGKSSVVKAGLIPALRRGALPGSDKWFYVELTPGAHPLEELEIALLRIAVNPPESLKTQLREDPRGLVRAVGRVLPDDNTELLLFIDQFEEVFTLVEDAAERTHLLESLLAAAQDPRSRLRIILTLRADFYDRPLVYPGFSEMFCRRTEAVIPLSLDELHQAIIGPAERVGLKFEPRLIAAIVKDVGEQPGALPLLQYALTELVERREGNSLTLDAYQQSGGVLGALASRADELYDGLDEVGQAAARRLFLRLVTLGEGTEDTRRRALHQELTSASDDMAAMEGVIDTFGKYRLLTFDRDPQTRAPTVEVAHEALIRSWSKLRNWLDASREEMRVQRRLSVATHEWQHAGQESSYLASGIRLQQFREFAATNNLGLTADERAFLHASEAERDRLRAEERSKAEREARIARRAQNFERAAIVLTVVGIFAVVATILAFAQSTSARSAVAIAEQTLTPIPPTLTTVAREVQDGKNHNESLRLAAAANALLEANGDPQLAILLGLHALKASYSTEADKALTRAVSASYYIKVSSRNQLGVTAIAFSTNGTQVVLADSNNVVHLRDVATGLELQSFSGHTDSVNALAISPNGQQILTGSNDQTAILWDVASGKQIRTFTGHGPVTSAAFTRTGDGFALGNDNASIQLMESATGHQIQTFVGHANAVSAMAFSPDGKLLVTGSYEATVRLWDVATGKQLQLYKGHEDKILSVTFGPDNRQVYSASVDRTVRSWSTSTGRALKTFIGNNDMVTSVAVSPDGSRVLTGSLDRSVRLWNNVTGGQLMRTLSGHNYPVLAVAFTPSGSDALSGSSDDDIRLWNLQDTQDPRVFAKHTDQVYALAFSPDGKMAVSGANDQNAMIWDVQSHTVLRLLQGHSDSVASAIFSPNGQFVLSGSSDKTVRLWSVATGQEIRQFNGHTMDIYSAVFSHSGKFIATASVDKTIRLWDVATGSQLAMLVGHTDTVNCVAFSANDSQLLTSSIDKTARIWDVSTGQAVKIFNHDSPLYAVMYSPDFKQIFTAGADGTVRIWDIASGRNVQTFSGHSGEVTAIAISPDGTLLLTGSNDRTALLWDIASGKVLRTLVGHTDRVAAAAFSPDGRYLLTGSWDRTVRLWDVDYRNLMAYACQQLQRDLSDAERISFIIPDHDPSCPKLGNAVVALPPTPTTDPGLKIPIWTPIPTAIPAAQVSMAANTVNVPLGIHIVVDGNLDDWKNIPFTKVTTGPNLSNNPAQNGSFEFAVAADDKYFYIAAKIPAKVLISDLHGINYWNEESMSFYFNFSGNLGATSYGPRVFQTMVNLINLGNPMPQVSSLVGQNLEGLDIQAVTFKTANGWGMEAAFPLEGLITPTPGQVIGFNIDLNGASQRDRDVKLIWSLLDPQDNSWRNPSLFGRAEFVPYKPAP